MGYYEGEIGTLGCSNGNNNGAWGQDGIWAILLLALLGFGKGYGGGFGGFGGGSGNGGSEFVGYELGKVATQADVASGFNNSAVLSNLNDIKLAQASNVNFMNQGFAGLNTVITNGNASIQQTLCQGFNGINTGILQSANMTERGFANLGYNLASCCCDLKGAIADVKYANEAQTCQLITNQNANTQRILDYLCNEKIATITAENVALKGQISNYNQTASIVSQLKTPCPIPAYQVPNPNCCYNGNSCSGCGF